MTKPDKVQIIDPVVVLEVAETTIADMEARQAAGENVAGPLGWQRGLAERMRQRVADEAQEGPEAPETPAPE